MDIQILEDLGLTNAEIKVYIALLELGSTSAGAVLEKTGLQNSVVHRALNSLIEKALINFILEGKRKVYQATDPSNFYNFIEDKKKRFSEILPELERKQRQERPQEAATIYKGVRGLTEIYNIMINQKGKEYNTFGGGEECAKRMGSAWWVNIHRKRIANRLFARQVFDETVRDFSEKEMGKLPITKIRFLSKEFAQFQETVIVGDYVAINVFTENCYGFLIKDRVVAEGYRKHFELLWDQGKN